MWWEVCDQFLVTKPSRCTNFSNLFLERNSTCFRQFLCPSSGVFHCTHSNGICYTGLLTACEEERDGTAVSSWSCSQAVSKPVWHIPLLCVQRKIPDDGRRNCPKHVEFYCKNKFEKLMHHVGFIIRNLTRCTVTWTSNLWSMLSRYGLEWRRQMPCHDSLLAKLRNVVLKGPINLTAHLQNISILLLNTFRCLSWGLTSISRSDLPSQPLTVLRVTKLTMTKPK